MPQMHTFADSFLVKPSYNNLVLANSTQNGSAIDTLTLLGSPPRRAAFVFAVATGVGTTANFQLQDSPDNSTWTNVSGATLGTAVAASTATDYVVNVDLAKRQRYLRAQLIGTGTAGNATGLFVLYQPEQAGIAGSQDQTPITV